MKTRGLNATFITGDSLFVKWLEREPILARVSLAVLIILPPTLIAASLDERMLNGINIWVKPIKFTISIAVYLGTLACFGGWIDRAAKQHQLYLAYQYLLCGSVFILLSWLYAAAIAGEPAHYNRVHPIFAPLYSLMGILSVILTSSALVTGVLIACNKRSTLAPHFRHAVVWSLLITFVFTVFMAGELASMDSHWIGGTPTDKNGLWPFGWSRDGGDLRVAHFFSLHAMHFIPIAALLTPTILINYGPRVFAALLSLAYCLLLFYVYIQAKNGLPFLPWLG